MQEVLQEPKSLSLGSLYGGYLHGLLHAPLQLMVTSLRSTNTESLERLQGTARRIGETVTSRRPAEVPPAVMIRTQAETEGSLDEESECPETEISRLAHQLPPSRCTLVKRKKLLTRRGEKGGQWDNFVALLKTISLFLEHGPGVWWHLEGNDIVMFHDGPSYPDYQPHGPPLRHLRSSTLQEVQNDIGLAWHRIRERKIDLPFADLQDD